MTWEMLNKDNIEEVKQMYLDYLEENLKDNYRANLKTFEEFIETELKLCDRCETIIYNDNELCECCYDEMFKI